MRQYTIHGKTRMGCLLCLFDKNELVANDMSKQLDLLHQPPQIEKHLGVEVQVIWEIITHQFLTVLHVHVLFINIEVCTCMLFHVH